MATVYRISEELFVDSFDLIALHSNMECYALAYYINKVFQILLVRAKKDLEIGTFSYPIFEYNDEVSDEDWYLVKNVVQKEESDENQGLFANSTTVKLNYLLSERKDINYLLKLYPENSIKIEKVIKAIRSIPRVSMAYQLHVDELKSKRNLIF
ncbi:MAG: IPExxxVDY family protein [Bacteroidota bacterium]